MAPLSNDLEDDNDGGSMAVIYTILEVCVAVIAIVGNLLVVVIFIQDRRLRKVTNFYLISLSVADLLVGAIGIPSAIMTKMGIPRSSRRLCLVMLCFLIVLCTVSIFNLVAVSLDRYWAILHPLDYHKRMTEKTAFIIICMCWILGSVLGFLPLFGWNGYPSEHIGCYFIPTMDYNFLTFMYLATIVFPALIMSISYIRIYSVVMQQLSLNKVRQLNLKDNNSSISKFEHKPKIDLITDISESHPVASGSINECANGECCSKDDQRRKRHTFNPLCRDGISMECPGSRNAGGAATATSNNKLSYSRREVKKAQKLFVIVVFFMICWIPLYTSNAIQAICPNCPLSSDLLNFLIILSHINSAGSPFLYAFQMKDFRQALRRLAFKGAINQRKLRDVRREELFSVTGNRSTTTCHNQHQVTVKDLRLHDLPESREPEPNQNQNEHL